MRTVVIIISGIVLLGLCVVGARLLGTVAPTTAIKVFLGVWLAVAAVNMWAGVARAGYSVREEFPIFLLIFAVPAAVAAFLWWRLA
jgi:hypothetical protein